jgi:hypothetical protein
MNVYFEFEVNPLRNKKVKRMNKKNSKFKEKIILKIWMPDYLTLSYYYDVGL